MALAHSRIQAASLTGVRSSGARLSASLPLHQVAANRRRAVVSLAAPRPHPEAEEDFNTAFFNTRYNMWMRQRLAQINEAKKAYGYAPQELQVAVEEALEDRPVLSNAHTLTELVQDHAVIADWHEQQWAKLRDAVNANSTNPNGVVDAVRSATEPSGGDGDY